jgi:hypothetical protein
MAAQKSKQKTDSAFPHPLLPPPDTTTKWRRHESTIAKSIGWLEGMGKNRLTTEIRICNSTRCWNTIGNVVRANDGGERERERERKTREGRREERKKEGRAHPPPHPAPRIPGARSRRTGPSNPCTRSGLRAYHTPVLHRRGHTRPAFWTGAASAKPGKGRQTGGQDTRPFCTEDLELHNISWNQELLIQKIWNWVPIYETGY